MAKKPNWDYALRIKGVSLDSLPISVLGEFLKEFASLLGEGARPVLDGIVKGSVVVRARQSGEHPAYTRTRLQVAANDPVGPAGRSYQRIADLMARNGARGDVIDREARPVVIFPGTSKAVVAAPDLIVSDVATLDGQVVGVSGADDTSHLRLLDRGGVEYRVTVRDLSVARELASRFREGLVRVHVHGTWKRSGSGKWEPHQLYADRVEYLDQASARAVFDELRSIDTGWSDLPDPLTELAEIRGGVE